MNGLTEKRYLELSPPSPEDAVSSQERILRELREEWGEVSMPASILRSLYPLCEQAGWRITVTLAWNGSCWEIICLEEGNKENCHYGLCADLGSTTVVMRLVDCSTGTVLGEESAYNHQISFGEDILTRIFYCKDQPEKLEEIRQAAVDTFLEVLDALERQTGIRAEQCGSMVVAGNTTMIHFFIGMDAFCVFSAPYAVQADQPGFLSAKELGLPIPGYVYCYPAKANYLGGDIISGMIATGLMDKEELSVFLDIGTNGELVVGNKEFLLCGAGAAGPALEGGVVRTGMRAVQGAVSRIHYNDLEQSWEYETIGEAAPIGICGSGIIDLIAELFLCGWIDIRGRYQPEVTEQIVFREGEAAVEYAPGLFFFQRDIDEFLRTKAAAYTMVEYMLNSVGIPMDEVKRFYVAGAFGTHVSKESAITIGLYPDIEREKIISAGNTSLDGTVRLLLDRSLLERLPGILDDMVYLQFGEVENFLHLMHGASVIPHTDRERFPSVLRKLEERRKKNL